MMTNTQRKLKLIENKTTRQGFKLQDGPILKRFRSSVVNLSKLCSHRLTDEMGKHVFSVFDHNVRHRGKASAIKTAKDHFNYVVKWMSGSKAKSAHWGQTDRTGIPRALRPLRRLIQSADPRDIRAVLTLLSHYRAEQAPGTVDLTSISGDGPNVHLRLAADISGHAPKFQGRVDLSSIHRPSLRYTTKTGPNGPGLLTSWSDLAALKKDPRVLRHLVAYLRQFRNNPREEESLDLEDNLYSTFDSVRIPVTNQVYHSRLSVKREYGGKDRVFAISDYYSKMALKPFHERVANVLRGIPEDYTFDQDRAADWIKSAQAKGLPLYSYDLTSATDRFPISVQQMVVFKLTRSRNFSRVWRDLVSDRDFVFKRQLYRYKVGQPMGFYSSWPVFALSHHCVVREAAKRAGVKRPQYALLGDDIVVEEGIAASYLEILRELGVEISENKSLWGNWAEFAKRIFVGGHEVTPLPSRLISQASKDPLVLGALVDHWHRLPSSCSNWLDQFRSLFAALSIKEGQRRKYELAATSLSLWTFIRKKGRETPLAGLATDPIKSLLGTNPEGRNGGTFSTPGSETDQVLTPTFIKVFTGYVQEHKFENLLAAISNLTDTSPQYEERLNKILASCESTGSTSNHPARVAWITYLIDLGNYLTEIQQIQGQALQEGGSGRSLPRPKSPNLDALTRRSPVAQGRVDLQAYSRALEWALEYQPRDDWDDEGDIDDSNRRRLRTEVRKLRLLVEKYSP